MLHTYMGLSIFYPRDRLFYMLQFYAKPPATRKRIRKKIVGGQLNILLKNKISYMAGRLNVHRKKFSFIFTPSINSILFIVHCVSLIRHSFVLHCLTHFITKSKFIQTCNIHRPSISILFIVDCPPLFISYSPQLLYRFTISTAMFNSDEVYAFQSQVYI